MKISKDLPQFESERALLVVAGKQEAVFYLVSDGEMEKIREIETHKSHYSDKEGFFAATMNSGDMRSGAVLEPEKWKTINEFNQKLLKELKNLTAERIKFDSLYMFCPAYMHKIIEKEIPADIKKKLKKVIIGDFCHGNPFDLLSRIKKGIY
jgi:hypothetical protein